MKLRVEDGALQGSQDQDLGVVEDEDLGGEVFRIWVGSGFEPSLCLGWNQAGWARLFPMPTGLRRYQEAGDLHHITFSCVRHRPILGTPEARDIFLEMLQRTRELYGMAVHGYVVMPTHVHILVSEPTKAKLSLAIQILKQRFSKTRTEEYVWESRYHDVNVWTDAVRIQKLRYIHRNPVKAGLVAEPDQWRWSSFRSYAYLEAGPVTIVHPDPF
jgi:putative transposase